MYSFTSLSGWLFKFESKIIKLDSHTDMEKTVKTDVYCRRTQEIRIKIETLQKTLAECQLLLLK